MKNPKLEELAEVARQQGIKALFEHPKRVKDFTFQTAGVHADLSKTHLTSALVRCYAEIADELGFTDKRQQQFSGAKINVTEDRAVLHTLLRSTKSSDVDLLNPADQVAAKESQSEFLNQIDFLREKFIESHEPIKNVIHIGIGGSSLGPQLLSEALTGLDQTIVVHFVSNIDAHEILAVLSKCEPASTLIFGVSKTFTTAETLMNIRTARDWMTKSGAVRFDDRFFAITASNQNASEFGVKPENIIVFPEWVGGRYSIWSAVSLSVAFVLGRSAFEEFLEGASQVDQDFYNRETSENLPFLLACLDHFYVNYFGAGSKATFAYDYRLRTLVPYLQQLETESNGKDRDINGKPVAVKTSPVVWGGTGTDMQHSTFQLIHQGTQFNPVEFILIKNPDHDLNNHHNSLLANGVAQSAALLAGRSLEEVDRLPENKDLSDSVKKSKVFAGDKPSSTFVLDSLSPATLGALLALYEHRTFCSGVLANINSFDQMGVELGKQLANDIEPVMSGYTTDKTFDPSTNNLLSILQTKSKEENE